MHFMEEVVSNIFNEIYGDKMEEHFTGGRKGERGPFSRGLHHTQMCKLLVCNVLRILSDGFQSVRKVDSFVGCTIQRLEKFE